MTDKTLDFPKGKGSDIHLIIYVPSTKGINKKISTKEFKKRIKETVDFLRNKLGGSTEVLGIGNYLSDKLNKSVSEKVAKIESFTSKEQYNKVDLEVKRFLEEKKKIWQQEAISYEFEEKLYFV